MPSTDLLYRGNLLLDVDTGSPRWVELWRSGSAVVAFEASIQVGAMRDAAISLTTDRRLRLEGVAPDESKIVWEGYGDPVAGGQWVGTTVAWPDGSEWKAATVTWTQYAVTAAAAGQAAVVLPGARTEVVSGQRWIVDGETRVAVTTARRGCGCGK